MPKLYPKWRLSVAVTYSSNVSRISASALENARRCLVSLVFAARTLNWPYSPLTVNIGANPLGARNQSRLMTRRTRRLDGTLYSFATAVIVAPTCRVCYLVDVASIPIESSLT